MPERFVKQFHKLETLEPRAEWLNSTRDFLVKKVERDTITYQTSWKYHFKVVMLDWQQRFVPATSKLIATLVIFGLISTTGLAARAEYRPDRTLYFVKKTLEKIELVLASSSYQEAAIYLKHVQNRKDEVVKLVQSESLTNAEKEKHINTVVSKLQQDLASASASLNIVDNADGKVDKITDLAKKISADSKDTVEVLTEVTKGTNLENVEKMINDVINSSENVEEEAIKVLVEKQGQNEATETEFTNEDLRVILEDKLVRSQEKIEVFITNLDEIEIGLNNTKCERSKGTMICVKDPLYIVEKEELNILSNKLIEAQKYITKAGELLAEENFIDTLSNIKEANQLINQVNIRTTEITKEEVEVIEEDLEIKDIDVKGVNEEVVPEIKEIEEPVTETTVDIIKEEDTE